MSALSNMVRNWLHRRSPVGLISAGSEGGVTAVHHMSAVDNPDAFSVVAIRNGFLICRRVYNPNGPDKLEAVYAASADELGSTLVAEMTAHRLKK